MTAERTSWTDLLEDLRRSPSAGQWVVCPVVFDEESGDWVPAGTCPTQWYDTKAEAEVAARRPDRVAWIAQVESLPGGWTYGVPYAVESAG